MLFRGFKCLRNIWPLGFQLLEASSFFSSSLIANSSTSSPPQRYFWFFFSNYLFCAICYESMSFSSILCQSRVYMINKDSHAAYISYLFKVVNHLRTLERLTGYNDLFTGAVFPHALKGFYWFSLYSRRIETTEQRNWGVSQCRGATFIWLSRSMTLSSPIHNGA